MRTAQGIFLGHTCDRKWLTRKARQQDIMVRNVSRNDFRDITIKLMAITKVSKVSALGVAIPLTGEYALAAGRLKRHTQAANAGKQINKGEITCSGLPMERQEQLI